MKAKEIEIGAVYENDWQQKIRVLGAASQKGWWRCEYVEDDPIWGKKGELTWQSSVGIKRPVMETV